MEIFAGRAELRQDGRSASGGCCVRRGARAGHTSEEGWLATSVPFNVGEGVLAMSDGKAARISIHNSSGQAARGSQPHFRIEFKIEEWLSSAHSQDE